MVLLSVAIKGCTDKIKKSLSGKFRWSYFGSSKIFETDSELCLKPWQLYSCVATIASDTNQRTTETTLNKITGHIYFVQNLESNEKRNSETKVLAHQHFYRMNIHPVTCELHVGLTYLYWLRPIWNIKI